ncbi:MAG: UvrB/UvrC motif-containing protein [Bacillota bacterium]|nr:UvrB/UvrC motif-containing protein [Bacillota bacterium]
MNCERCQRNEASVFITQIENGKRSEMHLCAECASKLTIAPFKAIWQQLAANAPLGLWKSLATSPQMQGEAAGGAGLACPACGLDYAEFLRSGKFGCSECYAAFQSRLDPILGRIQRGTRYVGRPLEGWEASILPTPPAAPAALPDTAETLDLDPARFHSLAPEQQDAWIRALRSAQKDAVAVEDYERAARCRDAIQRCLALQADGPDAPAGPDAPDGKEAAP